MAAGLHMTLLPIRKAAVVALTVVMRAVVITLDVKGLRCLPLLPREVDVNRLLHLSAPREKLGSTQRLGLAAWPAVVSLSESVAME